MHILHFDRNCSAMALSMVLFLLLVSDNQAVTNSTLANRFLSPLNRVRASVKPTPRVRLGPLVWDITLASYAEAYAEQRRVTCDVVPSNGPYGETIFWGMDDGWTPGQAVQSWVGERNIYNYTSNSCMGEGSYCGNYLQVVWNATKRVGCARVDCVDNVGVFINCNYAPRGNIAGQKPYET